MNIRSCFEPFSIRVKPATKQILSLDRVRRTAACRPDTLTGKGKIGAAWIQKNAPNYLSQYKQLHTSTGKPLSPPMHLQGRPHRDLVVSRKKYLQEDWSDRVKKCGVPDEKLVEWSVQQAVPSAPWAVPLLSHEMTSSFCQTLLGWVQHEKTRNIIYDLGPPLVLNSCIMALVFTDASRHWIGDRSFLCFVMIQWVCLLTQFGIFSRKAEYWCSLGTTCSRCLLEHCMASS